MSKTTKEKQDRQALIESLQDLFDMAGNSTKLAAQLDLHAFTVENWRRSGIPQKYWDKLFDLYEISPQELFTISKRCRNKLPK